MTRPADPVVAALLEVAIERADDAAARLRPEPLTTEAALVSIAASLAVLADQTIRAGEDRG